MADQLGLVDITVLVFYLVGILLFGLWVGSRVKTGADYFLAGRQLPWWAIGMSLVATDIGGTDIIGVGGAAYRYGMAVGNFEWIGCVPAMVVGAFVFIPFFWRAKVYTIPEFMERRFNAGMRTSLAVCWLIFMACNLGVMLLASAKMMEQLFGWPGDMCIYVTAAFVGLYTIAGGLAAVVYTDAIQCVIMILGCLLVLVLGLVEVGGMSGLRESLQQAEAASNGHDHLALILPVDTETPFPWTGIFFGLALILSPAYWIGNQAIVQRSLGARSEFQAQAAYISGAILKNVIPIVVAVPGVLAFVLYPGLKDPDQAFPQLISGLLPVGLKGLFLAAFCAALMSSVDSYLNSASTLLTNDIYKRFIHRNATDRQLLLVGRIVTAFLVIWAVRFALFLTTQESGIYAIFQTMMSFFQGPAFAVLLTGVLWRRATGVAALTAFLSGVCFAIFLYACSQPAFLNIVGWEPLFQIEEPFLYFSIWAFVLSLFVVIIVSLMSRPEPDSKIEGLIYRPWRRT